MSEYIVFKRLVANALLELLSESPSIDIASVSEKAGLNYRLACNMLNDIASSLHGIISLKDCSIVSLTTSSLELALSLISQGLVSPEKAAKHLTWRMFEEFAARVFSAYGYRVYSRVYKPPPKGFEIDVVAVSPSYRIGVVVDCKHWDPSYTSPSRLREVSVKHRERVERLAVYWGLARGIDHSRPKPKLLLPVLLVLRESLPRVLEGVVVVPASKLRGFMESIDYIIEDPGVALVKTR